MVRFTRKKIDTLTLGERLKKIRTERRLSLVDISKGTKIQVKYLGYLEEGEYLKLPADVYVKGFLKSYANYMGLGEATLIKEYLREKGIHRNIKKTDDIEKAANKPLNFSSFVVTPKIIMVGLVALFVLGCFWYLYSEVNSFVSSPRLFIVKPIDGSTIEGKTVHVAGIAEKDSLLFINDQPVLVNEKGEFGEDVGVQEGLNVITVKARNRFDKESVKTVSINAHYENRVDAEQNPTVENAGNTASFKLEVHVSPNPAWISVEADGNLVYSGVLLPQATQTFEANEKISITTVKGDETFVSLNGKDLGQLSSDSGAVRDAVFTANGRQ